MNIQRGEVIRVNLNPTSGREQSGNARPCLVISHTKYNLARKGIVVVTPITSTIKPKIKMMIPIPSEFKIYASVIAEQVRTIDLNSYQFHNQIFHRTNHWLCKLLSLLG
jgi:mRNA-degrading endonuclease toxin of MazEF toxin-antitoxin module